MDEARRFLRYVLPGVMFAITAPAFYLILRPDVVSPLFNAIKGSDLGAAVTGIVATGGLGFLFSVFHHAIRWRRDGKVIDHRPNLHRLGKVLAIEDATIESRRDAWVVTSTLWYTRRKTNDIIAGADDNARMLVDIAHMLGATRVAALSALIVALSAAALTSDLAVGLNTASLRFASVLALGGGLIALFQASYERAEEFAREVIDHALADALHLEFRKTKAKAVTYPLLRGGAAPEVEGRAAATSVPKRDLKAPTA